MKKIDIGALSPYYKTDDEMYDVSNLMPACRQYNFYKDTLTLEEFRKRLKDTMWENLKKEFRK